MEHFPISRPEIIDASDDYTRQAQDVRRTIGSNCFADEVTQREVRKIIRARRARERYFDPSLFADPAWDMLLELFASQIANRRVPVGSLCAASAVPATTALRWISNLEHAGLVRRQHDPLDGRRCFVSLSYEANLAMASLFESIAPVAVI